MGTMAITGAREAAKVLKSLPKKTRRKVLRATVRKPAQLARKAIRARAPVGPIPASARKGKRKTYGKIKDQIRAKRDGSRSSPTREVVVVDTGKAFWAFFYEKGTSKQPPRPFFVSAFEGELTPMIRKMVETLRNGVIREAKKLAGPLGSTLGRRRR